MRATKGKRNVCIFSNLFLLVACLSFCPSFSWASALSTPSDFFLEGPLDDQAVTSSKPHYGVATFSVGIEHWSTGHEAYEGQGFRTSSASETARGHLVARMYDPADGRFISRDPLQYIDGLGTYTYVHSSPLTNTDPTGLKTCAAVRYTNSMPPVKYNIGRFFQFEWTVEDVYEGRECAIKCCDSNGEEYDGVEFSGTYAKRMKFKFAAPVAFIPIGPARIPIKVFAGGEGGGKFSLAWNSCTGDREESGCGYVRASAGLEGCVEDPLGLFKACVKGEGYYQKKWCMGAENDSCGGARISVKFCNTWPWNRCREYILLDYNNCSDGGAGGG